MTIDEATVGRCYFGANDDGLGRNTWGTSLMDSHDIESRHRTRFLLSDTVPLSETAPLLNKENDSSYNIPLVEYSTVLLITHREWQCL